MISVTVVCYLILKLTDIRSATREAVLFLGQSFPLSFLFDLQFRKLSLLALSDELQLLCQSIDFLTQFLRLVFR